MFSSIVFARWLRRGRVIRPAFVFLVTGAFTASPLRAAENPREASSEFTALQVESDREMMAGRAVAENNARAVRKLAADIHAEEQGLEAVQSRMTGIGANARATVDRFNAVQAEAAPMLTITNDALQFYAQIERDFPSDVVLEGRARRAAEWLERQRGASNPALSPDRLRQEETGLNDDLSRLRSAPSLSWTLSRFRGLQQWLAGEMGQASATVQQRATELSSFLNQAAGELNTAQSRLQAVRLGQHQLSVALANRDLRWRGAVAENLALQVALLRWRLKAGLEGPVTPAPLTSGWIQPDPETLRGLVPNIDPMNVQPHERIQAPPQPPIESLEEVQRLRREIRLATEFARRAEAHYFAVDPNNIRLQADDARREIDRAAGQLRVAREDIAKRVASIGGIGAAILKADKDGAQLDEASTRLAAVNQRLRQKLTTAP